LNPNAVAQRIVDAIEQDFATFVGTGAPLMAVYAAQRAIDPGAYPILGSGARPS
jgi:acyl CoA:acetate/3-ketoacid CoA transferase beta subunit